MGDRGPEARDLQHHLRAVVAQEGQVLGGLEVVPDVVEDRRVDVPLVVAEIGLPAARERVEMHALGLLLALAAALPGEHRTAQPCLAGRRARLAQPPVAVQQQTPGDLRHAEAQEQVHVKLIPEHMPPVGLAVEAAGRYPGVQVGSVMRADLDDMADMQLQQQLNAVVTRHADITHPPQLVPGRRVTGERFLEAGVTQRRRPCLRQRVADRGVARGEEGHHLLDPHRGALPDIEREHLLDVILHLVKAAFDGQRLAAAVEDTRARRLADVQVRLARLHLQRDHLRPECPR